MEKACVNCGVVVDLDKARHEETSYAGQRQLSYSCPVCGALLARRLGDKLLDVESGKYDDPTDVGSKESEEAEEADAPEILY